jgi:probable phosphoglycerate mutase
MKKLLFIRHGQTIANIEGRFAGQIETPLSKEGRTQAERAGAELRQIEEKIDVILTSPYSRALDTASIIAEELEYPIGNIVQDARLSERALGILEGTDERAFMELFTRRDIDDAFGVEPLDALEKRAQNLLQYLNEAYPDGEVVLCVGHGVFGRALRRVVNEESYFKEYVGDPGIPNAKIVVFIDR